MDRTTIFISSVAQDTLSSIRNAVFEELKNMGHEPIHKFIAEWTNYKLEKAIGTFTI